MTRLSYPAGGAFLAAFLAGPIFVITAMLAYYVNQIPATVPVGPDALIVIPGVFVTVPFGFLLAILPCLIGSALMTWVSALDIGRARLTWIVAGCALPYFISFGAEGVVRFALMATGGACALICRRYAEERS